MLSLLPQVNFGSEDAWGEQLTEYTFAAKVPLADRVQGSQGPATRADCEVRGVQCCA